MSINNLLLMIHLHYYGQVCKLIHSYYNMSGLETSVSGSHWPIVLHEKRWINRIRQDDFADHLILQYLSTMNKILIYRHGMHKVTLQVHFMV